MVTFYDVSDIPDQMLSRAVVAARYQGQWVFSRKQGRDTWDLPSGRRKAGESILDTARRALLETAGGEQDPPIPICAYGGSDKDYGLLCIAEVTRLGPPPEGGIEERGLYGTPPERLTCPDLCQTLYDRVQGWCNLQNSPDELWDIYDREGNPTGRTHRRGDPLAAGDYHLTVHVWLQDEDGRFLLTRRDPSKGYALLWECTGGSALAGEDSRAAAVREVLEETGLTIRPEAGRCLLHRQGFDYFNDVWLFRQKFHREAVKLLPGETVDAKWVTASEILEMDRAGEMCPFAYLHSFFSQNGSPSTDQ